MNKPDNKMLIAVLDISKETDDATYFKGAPFGLNSISANLKGGKLYIEIQKWPKRENAAPYNPSTEEDAPF